jgi:D-threonate/D-erythronate kinase
VQIAIIADDLTSATDGGIQFARVGFRSVVTLDCLNVSQLAGWPVVCVDADSRAKTTVAAAGSIATCVRALRGRHLLYKTVDSTLRGHIASELRAAQRESGRSRTVFAPAFPANGRTTRGGRQFLDGVPLSETAFSHDPSHPITEDHIPSILTRGGFTGIRVLSRAALRDRAALDAAFEDASCVVADAETDEDLEILVHAVDSPRDVLWVGSPGLARALGLSVARQASNAPTGGIARRLIVAVGSLNPVSRRQLDALRRGLDSVVIEVDASSALENPGSAARIALESAPAAQAAAGAEVVIVTSTATNAGSAGAAMVHVAEAIARVVESLHCDHPFDGFILTGGDTAVSVVRRLGATGIELESEFAPGVAVGNFFGNTSARVLTKAGGFGDDAALVRACQFLRGAQFAGDVR